MQSKKTSSFKSYLLLTALLPAIFVMAMSSCSDNDAAGPDTRSLFIGSYDVQDSSSASGYIYEYEVTIVGGAGNQIEISNFADMFNVPVKANLNGTSFTIPSQTFTNPSSGNSITVSGSGAIIDGVLTFTYVTTGYLDYEGTCVAEKQLSE